MCRLLNLCAPFLGIPFVLFLFSTALGLLPYITITTMAGQTIFKLTESQQFQLDQFSVFDRSSIVQLLLLSSLIIAVIGINQYWRKKRENKQSSESVSS